MSNPEFEKLMKAFADLNNEVGQMRIELNRSNQEKDELRRQLLDLSASKSPISWENLPVTEDILFGDLSSSDSSEDEINVMVEDDAQFEDTVTVVRQSMKTVDEPLLVVNKMSDRTFNVSISGNITVKGFETDGSSFTYRDSNLMSLVRDEKAKLDALDAVESKLYSSSRAKSNKLGNLTYAGTKLTQMFATFSLLEDTSSVDMIDLCSCPGDFPRAILQVKQWRQFFPVTKLKAVCIGDSDNYHKEIKHNSLIRRAILDVTDPSSFDKIKIWASPSLNLITADGAVDLPQEFEGEQEVRNKRLLFSEVLHILNCVNVSCVVVLKLLGVNTYFNLSVITLLSKIFKVAFCHKPKASPFANNELYFIGKMANVQLARQYYNKLAPAFVSEVDVCSLVSFDNNTFSAFDEMVEYLNTKQLWR
jgi:23S rRNA U2552 (ribose-2'-O)-methylase RlmE/FtsJ